MQGPGVAGTSSTRDAAGNQAAVYDPGGGTHLAIAQGFRIQEQDGATIIHEPNQGCIGISENPVLHKRTKHIDIRYHFIREKVERGDVKLQYLPTEHQLADIMTKPLPKPRIMRLRSKIMGYSE